MEHLISMYIDNELSLEEKIIFIRQVHGNKVFKDDAISLLEQEKLLSAALLHQPPESKDFSTDRKGSMRLLGLAMTAILVLTLGFLAGTNFSGRNEPYLQPASVVKNGSVLHRFVLYYPGSKPVEIAGSFTKWQKKSLVPVGTEGYWEITLEVPAGEHRYAFFIDGSQPLPDPTVAAREPDGFGSLNSILNIES